MSPQVAQFLKTVSAQAAPLKTSVLIIVRDPADRVVHFVGTQGALDNMRPEIVQKVGVPEESNEAVTGWE